MNNKWLCITDKGIKFIPPLYTPEGVIKLLTQNNCKEYTVHRVNEDNILYVLSEYLEDCYKLEYKEVYND